MTLEMLEKALEALETGGNNVKPADLPYQPEEWKLWQRTRCGKWMAEWLERTMRFNDHRLRTAETPDLYRAQGASEVLESLRALLLEQTDPDRPVAEDEESANA